MARIIITTSNNLVFDNRVHKVSVSLIKMGFDVLQTGRNFPVVKQKQQRPGQSILFKLPFNKGPLFYFSLNLYTFIFLILHHFEMLWAVDMDTLPACRLAGLLKRKPVIFDSHEFFSESPEIQHKKAVRRIWIFLEKAFIPGCKMRFTVSPGLVNLYKKRYNSDFNLLRNLPFKNLTSKVPVLKNDNHIILYQGALNVGRGIAETIRAMEYLPGYRFMIVGRGDCTEELKILTADLGLEDRVEFTGPVPFEELPRYQENAVVGMCLLENMGLSYYHSLPNRIFDYIQAGIPVITSNFPDISGIVKTYDTGLLLDNMNPETIATAIKKACENTELRKKWQQTIPEAGQMLIWEKEEKAIQKIKRLQNHQE